MRLLGWINNFWIAVCDVYKPELDLCWKPEGRGPHFTFDWTRGGQFQLEVEETIILMEYLDIVLPFITAICNKSLQEGRIPSSQRHAIVTPILKKSGLDAANVLNYRPISNLTYISKQVERMVNQQVVAYLDENKLLPKLQSGFRARHSTETALLKVLSDILLSADQQQVTLLVLLDMSAAFDTVDHAILLQRLESSFGVSGGVLSWLSSFLDGRTQRVHLLDSTSSVESVRSGVPQGSILGPLLFLLYTADIPLIASDFGLNVQCYADDGQLYISSKAGAAESSIELVTACINQLDQWMSSNRLKLNSDKTQLIWLGSRQQLLKVNSDSILLGASTVRFQSSVVDLGVVLDSNLSMRDHVSRLCRTSYYQLRQLRFIRRSLTTWACTQLVHALVNSRLDYCNSLLSGITDQLLSQLQSVLRASARLVLQRRKFDPISNDIREKLHWLPIRQRVIYKLCLLVFKCLRGEAPSYLCEMLTPLSGHHHLRPLRSAAHGNLHIPRTRTRTFGPRSFSVSGPSSWNKLPDNLKNIELTLEVFKSHLKTHFFHQAYVQ